MVSDCERICKNQPAFVDVIGNCLVVSFLKPCISKQNAYDLEFMLLVFDRYFRKHNMFGLACFENLPVESRMERGARMKSVGILATSYTVLYRHMQFLESQVR